MLRLPVVIALWCVRKTPGGLPCKPEKTGIETRVRTPFGRHGLYSAHLDSGRTPATDSTAGVGRCRGSKQKLTLPSLFLDLDDVPACDTLLRLRELVLNPAREVFLALHLNDGVFFRHSDVGVARDLARLDARPAHLLPPHDIRAASATIASLRLLFSVFGLAMF